MPMLPDIFEAIAADDLQAVEAMVDAGFNLNWRNPRGMTPLMFAAGSASPERILEILIGAGAVQ